MVYLNDHIADFDWEKALPLLSEQRREQTLKFKYELGRKTCAGAYLLLCEALRKEYGIMEPPVFEYGEHGKPYIVGHPDIHFNISHCKEAVLCVTSPRPVGVDVEFIRLWTMKEAVLKLTGEGISKDLKTVLTGKEQVQTIVNMEKNYIYSIIYG